MDDSKKPEPFVQLASDPTLQSESLVKVSERYLAYYAGTSSHTSKAKQKDIEHFLNFLVRHNALPHSGKVKVSHWDLSATQRFVDDLLERGEAPATAARRLATLKHMGRTLSEKIPGFVNPAREVKPPRVHVTRPKGIDRNELQEIRDSIASNSTDLIPFTQLRNYVLFELLLDTGLRADEVRLLRLGQFDEHLEWIKNVRTKGRHYRNVYVTTKMRPLLREYLARRSIELQRVYTVVPGKLVAALPVFISTYRSDPALPDTFLMSSKTVWRAIRHFSRNRKLHPHLLRHSYALDLLESAHDIRLVAQALGHSDVRVTMRYTERQEEEVARALEKSRKKESANDN